MKGLTHFVSGIAAASFIRPVVERCTADRFGYPGAEASFLLALAGLYGIMPDTLDFKFGRFFERADVEVTPDPHQPDVKEMARLLGQTMDQAYHSGKPRRIQFHTAPVSNDRWRRYELQFDEHNHRVIVRAAEIVSTSQVPVTGTVPPDNIGTYDLKYAKLVSGGTRNTTVDIMSGPMYGFSRDGDYLRVEFLPWHRTWSHSCITGLIAALPLYLIAFLAGWHDPWMYPLIAWIGFATHVTEDLTGHLGGSLLWPLIKPRCKGLAWFHAANSDANFITTYLAGLMIIFNLDRFGSRLIPMPAYLFFSAFFVFPILIYLLPGFLGLRRERIKKLKPVSQVRSVDPARKSLEEIQAESESI